ncbi:MAG: hypothetical protein WD972_02270 [Candidatus Andersenbacteria bacterium]
MSTTPRYPELIIETAMNETKVQLSTSVDDTASVSVASDRYLGRTILEAVAELSPPAPLRFGHIQLQPKSGHPAAVRASAVVATLLAWATSATMDIS